MEAPVVSGEPWIDTCWWGGYKLYHSAWEPPIMCVAWKISRSLGCYVDNESMPLKILFISISKLELWHLCKSLFPSAKGLSIYFYVEPSSSYSKALVGEHRRHLHVLLLVYIEYDLTRSLLP